MVYPRSLSRQNIFIKQFAKNLTEQILESVQSFNYISVMAK